MAFLQLNGVTIPTAKGGTVEIQEIGQKRRALDGTMLREVRAFKRRWKFQTKPLPAARAQAIMGLVQGRGYKFSFDNSAYASNGLGPAYIPAGYRKGTGADGALAYDENGAAESFLGTHSLCNDAAGSNLLALAAAECSSTAPFTALNGAVLSVNTTHFWQGTSSLQVVATSTPFSGVQITAPLVSGTTGDTYTCSVYVKGSGNPLSLLFIEAVSGNQSGPVVTFPANVWRRASVSLTSSVASPQWVCRVITPAVSTAQTFRIDGFQVEKNPGGAYPTSFMTPGAPRTAADLRYGASVVGEAGMTVNFWLTKPYLSAEYTPLFSAEYLNDQSTSSLIAAPISTPGTVSWVTQVGGSAFDTLNYVATYTGWHMVTAVLRRQPDTGDFTKSLYFDGVLRATSSPVVPSALGLFAAGVRAANGTIPTSNRIDELQVLPYPVDAATVAAWYANASSLADTPFLTAAGDAMEDVSVSVLGRVDKVGVVGYRAPTGWLPNAQVVEFTLEEA